MFVVAYGLLTALNLLLFDLLLDLLLTVLYVVVRNWHFTSTEPAAEIPRAIGGSSGGHARATGLVSCIFEHLVICVPAQMFWVLFNLDILCHRSTPVIVQIELFVPFQCSV